MKDLYIIKDRLNEALKMLKLDSEGMVNVVTKDLNDEKKT